MEILRYAKNIRKERKIQTSNEKTCENYKGKPRDFKGLLGIEKREKVGKCAMKCYPCRGGGGFL